MAEYITEYCHFFTATNLEWKMLLHRDAYKDIVIEGMRYILEGSFGNEKENYFLKKIPARNQTTETCWIFFGIFTSNAVRMADRIALAQQHARAA